MRLRYVRLIGTALSALLFAVTAGCGGDDDNPPAMQGPNGSQIRAIHAAPNAPVFDVYVNGGAIAAGTGFGNQTGFANVVSGPTRLQITQAGTPAANARIDLAVALAGGLRYSAVAIGDANQTSGPERLQAVVIEDGGAPPGSGNVKLRVVHGATGLGQVDVFLTDPGAALPATPTFANLIFSTVSPASATPALEVSSGRYRIRIRPAGQQNVIFDSGPITLNPDSDIIAVAVKDLAPGPSNSTAALLMVPSTGNGELVRDNGANLRVGNLSPNLAPVDVFLKAVGAANDPTNRIASGLIYIANVSTYLRFAAGTYDMSAAIVNTLNGIADLSSVTLDRGKSVSVFAIGLVNGSGSQAPVMKAYVDDLTPIAGQAKVRVIHLAPDSPPVDLVTLNGGVIAQRLVTNLAYADATTTPVTLAPGAYTLAVVPTGASTPLLPAGGVPVTFVAGDVQTVVAVGTLAPNATNPPAQPLNLIVLDDLSQGF